MISQVKNLTLSETLTSRACLFKMEFNHGDIFLSIHALFIISLIASTFTQRGKFIKELGFNWLLGSVWWQEAWRSERPPGTRVGLPALRSCCRVWTYKIFTKENWKFRAELWGWGKVWEQPQDHGKRGKTMTAHQTGFWHEGLGRAQDSD